MLTYETLRKILQEERAANKLVSLPEDFFESVKSYLEKKSQISREKEDVWELDSARRTLQELLEVRERKVLELALYHVRSGMEPGDLIPEEKELFERVVQNIKDFQAKRKVFLEGKPEKRLVVAVLDSVPEFVGTNLKTYGPFKKGDVVSIPEDNAKLLIGKKLAQSIETA